MRENIEIRVGQIDVIDGLSTFGTGRRKHGVISIDFIVDSGYVFTAADMMRAMRLEIDTQFNKLVLADEPNELILVDE